MQERELQPLESEEEGERGPNPELERLKMLKQWAFLATILIVLQFVIAVVMYPQAVGVIGSLGVVAGTMGFAAGRHLHRQDKEVPSINVRKTQEALENIEDRLTRRMQRLDSENSIFRQEISNLESKLYREQAARRDAQRELVEHMRDCNG